MKIAFDRSARTIDADGRLHVARSHISKAAVNPYYGREIPGAAELGLDLDKVYKLLRDPAELEKAAQSFARLPILSEHVHVTVDNPRPELIIGAIGSELTYDHPYLDADLCFWDSPAIAGIETGDVIELSSAYRYVPIMEPGEFEGQPYDGRMTQIVGSHLALVEVGRAGSDVLVADANPFFNKVNAMKMSKLGKALFASLCAASPVLAQDSGVAALVGTANKKTFKAKEVKAKLLALDSDLDPQQLDNVIDALLDVEQDPMPTATPAAAADESPADKVRAMLAGKVDEATIAEICSLIAPAPAAAVDEFPPKEDDDSKVEAAMDGLRKELREAAEACRDVREVVGEVIGMDSASDVYAFALDHMKVDRTDVTGTPALRALFKVAAAGGKTQPRVIAQDGGASAVKQFPGLARLN